MAILMFKPGVNELLTYAGQVHLVPEEIIDQAEDNEVLETAARWAYKARLIDRVELSDVVAKRA